MRYLSDKRVLLVLLVAYTGAGDGRKLSKPENGRKEAYKEMLL